MSDLGWRDNAACIGKDIDLFFGAEPRGAVDPRKEAFAICGGCPVKQECLMFALEKYIPFGIFGGMNNRQRLAYKRKNKIKIKEHDREYA